MGRKINCLNFVLFHSLRCCFQHRKCYEEAMEMECTWDPSKISTDVSCSTENLTCGKVTLSQKHDTRVALWLRSSLWSIYQKTHIN